MKSILKIAVLLILTGQLSCDKNEKLQLRDINEPTITGIADAYEIALRQDRLVIDPQIAWSMDSNEDSYEFTWKAVLDGSAGASALAGTIISTSRKLDIMLNLNPGSYTLYFKARDKSTNIIWTKSTKLQVVTLTGRGFMVFGDDQDGFADLQMITMKSSGEEAILKGLLVDNGLPKLKGAIDVMFTGTQSASSRDNRKVWISTNDGSYYLDYQNFSSDVTNILAPMAYISYPIPNNFYPILVGPRSINGKQVLSNRMALMNNGYLLKNEEVTSSSPEFYSDALNVIGGNLVEIAPFVSYCLTNAGGNWVMYDRTNKQFISNVGFSYISNPITTAAAAAPLGFPWNQTASQRDLVYMENTMDTEGSTLASTIGNTYALMKDVSSKYFIYKFFPRTRVQLRSFTLTPGFATDFDKAERYAFYSNRSIVFYTVGSKLYGYDFSTGFEKIKLIKDFGNDEITMLKFDVQNTSTANNDLYIATHNSSGGTLRKFKVENNPNDIVVNEVTSWGGLCRVVAIDWRND